MDGMTVADVMTHGVHDLGRLLGMVTNRDLPKVFLRPDAAIKEQVVDLLR